MNKKELEEMFERVNYHQIQRRYLNINYLEIALKDFDCDIEKIFLSLSRAKFTILNSLDNGFNDSKKYVETEAKKFDFELPERYFPFLMHLQGSEFDESALYTPDYVHTIRNIEFTQNYDSLMNLASSFSENIGENVLCVYKDDIFKIPRFQLYSNGYLIRKTIPVGKYDFNPNHFDDEISRRMKQNAKSFIEQLSSLGI